MCVSIKAPVKMTSALRSPADSALGRGPSDGQVVLPEAFLRARQFGIIILGVLFQLLVGAAYGAAEPQVPLLESSLKALCEKKSIPEACYNWGLEHEKAKRFAEANKYYTKACDYKLAEGCLRAAYVQHEHLKNVESALLLYGKACTQNLGVACYFWGRALGELKRWDQATKAFVKVCPLPQPKNIKKLDQKLYWNACFGLGNALFYKERFKDAALALRVPCYKAEIGGACHNLALAYRRVKDLAKALEAFTKACTLGVDESCLSVALILLQQGEIKKAQVYLEQLCDGKNWSACAKLAETWQNQQEWQLAAEYYGRACKGASATSRHGACFNWGQMLLKLGDTLAARKALGPSCEEGFFRSCQALGALEESEGFLNKARAHYSKACYQGVLAESCLNLGHLEYGEGEFEKAVQHYKPWCLRKHKSASNAPVKRKCSRLGSPCKGRQPRWQTQSSRVHCALDSYQRAGSFGGSLTPKRPNLRKHKSGPSVPRHETLTKAWSLRACGPSLQGHSSLIGRRILCGTLGTIAAAPLQGAALAPPLIPENSASTLIIACAGLGLSYSRMLGFADQARHYLAKACGLEHYASCHNLGALEWNIGNRQEARKWFEKACRGGFEESCGFKD